MVATIILLVLAYLAMAVVTFVLAMSLFTATNKGYIAFVTAMTYVFLMPVGKLFQGFWWVVGKFQRTKGA